MPLPLAAFAALALCSAPSGPGEPTVGLTAQASAQVSGQATDQDSVEHVRRWYDLRAIVSSSVTVMPMIDLRLHLASAWIDALEPDSYDVGVWQEEPLTVRECLHAIGAAVDAQAQAESTRFEAHAGRLLVVGNEAAHAAAVAAVQALHSAVSDTVAIELYRLDGDRIPKDTSAVLTADDAAALLAGLSGSLVACETLRPGRAARLGDSDVVTYLQDYDVEVAQYMKVADPVVSTLMSGIEVGVRVDRAADGRRFVVRTWGRDGGIDGPLRVLRLDALGGARIELPRVRTSLWTASAIIEPGGALVIEHGGGGQSALILRIPVSGATATPDSIFPLGELMLPPIRPRVHELSMAAPSGGAPRIETTGEFESVAWDEDDTVASLAEEVLDDAMARGLARVFGSSLLLSVPDAIDVEARETFAALRASLRIGTISVEVRHGFVAAEDVVEILSEGGAAHFAATATGRLLGAVIENDALLLVGGTETAYLQDHDIQVAQAVMMADPIIAGYFDGIALWCAPMRQPNGVVSAWFDIQAQTSDPIVRGIKTSIFVPSAESNRNAAFTAGTHEEALAIELPVTHRATSRTLVESKGGAWSLVTARQLPGTEQVLVVVARMSVR